VAGNDKASVIKSPAALFYTTQSAQLQDDQNSFSDKMDSSGKKEIKMIAG
jgi:hypothetical protein